MKRIIVLALAACMVLGAALGASAAEFKASGYLYAGYDYYNIDEAGKMNDFSQRFRTQIDIVTSEALSGTVYFEINNTWGDAASGGDLGTDGTNVQTRRAYMTFLVPSTSVQVRAGLQGFALPGAVSGSPILNDDVAAIVASTSFDNVGVTAFYARPEDNGTGFAGSSDAAVDFFGAIVAADFDVVNVAPYFMLSSGSNEEIARDAQWYGVAVDAAPIENLTLAFDAMFGKASGEDAGFFLAGKAAYATDFAVPAFLAWYGSGNGSDGEGIMPSFDGKDFAPTTFVGFGAVGTSADALFGNALGKWGVSLQASEITFLEKVSHTVRLSYIRGTNDDVAAADLTAAGNGDIADWSDDDSAIEFDFATVYAAYDNLDVILDLAYAVTDLDDAAPDTDDVFKAALGVQYNF